MNLLALWIGKICFIVLKLLGRRGAALPGLIVEKLTRNFLDTKLQTLPQGAVIIIGTNGKTTTTKMLAHVLGKDMRVLTNPTGSNFTRGIVASIVEQASWSGKLPFDVAVLELDEAYAVKFVLQHKPRGVVVLNIMRDQMDRFAEIDQTAQMLAKVVASARGFIVLNADDIRVANLAKETEKEVVTFGVAPTLKDIFLQDDELYGKSTVVKKAIMPNVELASYKGTRATFTVSKATFSVDLVSPGAHNAQNAAAVIATVEALKLNPELAAENLANVRPAFGRGEAIKVQNKTLVLQLVKNPGGFRHAILGVNNENNQISVVAINDDYPDGRDVSWLWDVDFKNLHGVLMVSGVRAADMALRFKYDDKEVSLVEPNLNKIVSTTLSALNDGETAVIYATYTAMLELRTIISKITEVEPV